MADMSGLKAMKNIIKKLFQWCPQPPQTVNNKSVLTAALKFSPKILAALIVLEIFVLLVAPITYLALLGPTVVYTEGKIMPLTEEQIKTSWPNLPTGDEIKSSGVQYNFFNSYSNIENCARINMFANMGIMHLPIRYSVYVPDSSGCWIEVPDQFLATENPPVIQPDGFMGTYLPLSYGVIVSIIIGLTIGIGVLLILRNRR